MTAPAAAGGPRRAALLVLVALAGLTACTGGAGTLKPLPPPPSTVPLPPTTTPPDYTGVILPVAQRGRTTTTVAVMGPGKANLKGTVTGPDGAPVAGAFVQVERQVGDAKVSVDLTSGPDGAWSLPNVMGGRYRVRAWRPPDLAIVEPAFSFLAATDDRTIDIKLAHFFGTAVHPAVAPNPPRVGEPATLVVLVTSRSVDNAGLIQGVPKVGVPVDMAVAGGWAVPAPSATVTDAEGRARWELVCQASGSQPIRLVVGEEQYTLALPACVEPPPPPTAAPAPGSTVPGGATTTTRPVATTTRPTVTTTTTRPAPATRPGRP